MDLIEVKAQKNGTVTLKMDGEDAARLLALAAARCYEEAQHMKHEGYKYTAQTYADDADILMNLRDLILATI